jgi:predicted nucleotidyltransferase component of viral defense system
MRRERRMITRADIVERVLEWGLTEEVVEKDYVLGWLLWGIGTDEVLGQHWVFKGGTCLKKCYIETYRFSEDLDFTVLPGGPYLPDDIKPHLQRVLARVADNSGINFSAAEPTLRLRPDGLSVEGRAYYIGPRQTPAPARVKLDLTANEKVIRPPVLRDIGHPYPDQLPGRSAVRCYSFEELFAEKLRAMAQRGRPRDLYDVVNLFRRNDLRLYPNLIHDVLAEKCAVKGMVVPTADDIISAERMAELETDWTSMLSHQLPALPPIEPFLEELPVLFSWLDGTVTFEELPPSPYAADEDQSWSPPPTIATWRVGIPLETIRFAATNHLCVDLTYQGSRRLIEPYSLRRSHAGNYLLHAERVDGSGHRSYRVDQVQAVSVTTTPFRPRRPIEFSARGPLRAPLQNRTSTASIWSAPRAQTRKGPVYVYRCTMCHREFEHTRSNSRLGKHNNSSGSPCLGRSGVFVSRRS